MNLKRMIEALEIVSEECYNTRDCNECPIKESCFDYLDESIGYYADDIVTSFRMNPKPDCPYCIEDEEKPRQYRCSESGEECYGKHSETCILLEDGEQNDE